MNFERAMSGLIQLNAVFDASIELARGDFALRQIAASGGKTALDMAGSRALVGAAQGKLSKFNRGASFAGRQDLYGNAGMQATRDSMAKQLRSAKKNKALAPSSGFQPGEIPKPAAAKFDDGGKGRAAAESVNDWAASSRRAMIGGSSGGENFRKKRGAVDSLMGAAYSMGKAPSFSY